MARRPRTRSRRCRRRSAPPPRTRSRCPSARRRTYSTRRSQGCGRTWRRRSAPSPDSRSPRSGCGSTSSVPAGCLWSPTSTRTLCWTPSPPLPGGWTSPRWRVTSPWPASRPLLSHRLRAARSTSRGPPRRYGPAGYAPTGRSRFRCKKCPSLSTRPTWTPRSPARPRRWRNRWSWSSGTVSSRCPRRPSRRRSASSPPTTARWR